MASTVTVTVPSEQGEAVLETLLNLYQTQAEALHVATLAYLDDRDSLVRVLDARDELAEIEALIELVGWKFGGRAEPLELVGSPALVREAVHAMLVDAAEGFARGVDRYERGETGLGQLRAQAHAAATVLGLFIRLEDPHADSRRG
jgi:hypothetical protein